MKSKISIFYPVLSTNSSTFFNNLIIPPTLNFLCFICLTNSVYFCCYYLLSILEKTIFVFAILHIIHWIKNLRCGFPLKAPQPHFPVAIDLAFPSILVTLLEIKPTYAFIIYLSMLSYFSSIIPWFLV